MTLQFSKYHGAGNDFILIDNRKQDINLNTSQIAFLCHRHFGIGSDGLMLLENHEQYDFFMRYFNPDGSEGMMCGNGGRCIIRFANELGIINQKTVFLAPDGVHEAEINAELISLKMNDVNDSETIENNLFLNTGAPHYIKFTENLNQTNVYTEGKQIRFSPLFKARGGTNINFVHVNDKELSVRTYERGVENETLACGTGIVASAIAAYISGKIRLTQINVKALGGDLKVKFETTNNSFSNIWLIGPAEKVFTGTIVL